MGVSENRENPFLPNGFADHYPVFKWLFVWEYTLFSDKPICEWYDINDIYDIYRMILGIWYMIYGVWCMIWCMIWIDMMYVHIIF